jgi:hypothetical protein
MDPEACLDCAQSALTEGDLVAASYALKDYWCWRRGGGFQPQGGDQRAVWLRLAVTAQRRPWSWSWSLPWPVWG